MSLRAITREATENEKNPRLTIQIADEGGLWHAYCPELDCGAAAEDFNVTMENIVDLIKLNGKNKYQLNAS